MRGGLCFPTPRIGSKTHVEIERSISNLGGFLGDPLLPRKEKMHLNKVKVSALGTTVALRQGPQV